MSRFFSSSQRAALYLAADGKCTKCGTELTPGWHADHIHPHSKSGHTDVVNGQALCGRCNLQKGSKTSMTPELSAWQHAALRKFQGRDADFLAVACPGAGKTRFALAAARDQMDRSGFDNVIVVVPTRHLREQWAESATAFEIHLDKHFENGNGVVARDFTGVVVTYAAVASQPHLYRRMATPRTLVIFDEVHHAGDAATWGGAMRQAFEGAGRRLLLSGTPKRTDGTEVPFVTYDEDGAFVEDYLYDYGQALEDYRIDADGARWPVVRPTDFNVLDGRAHWISATEAEVKVSLSDASDDTMSNALRSALEPSGDWMLSTLTRADAELTAKRSAMPDAAGLVVAADQFRARKYAAILERITGEPTALAISDEPASTDVIKGFKDGSSRWIVAVAMVSEGVDIPRLAVCVYASQTRTEMFFRQVVGRVVRSRGEGDVPRASMFIPGVEPLVRFASEIERTTKLALQAKEDREASEREAGLLDERIESVILGASESVQTGVISHGEQFTAEEIARAQAWIASNGSLFSEETSPVALAAFVRSLGHSAPTVQAQDAAPRASLADQKKQARNDLTKLVGKVAHRVYGGHTRAPEVRYDLRKRGYPPISECSLDQIQEQLQVLAECLSHGEQVA